MNWFDFIRKMGLEAQYEKGFAGWGTIYAIDKNKNEKIPIMLNAEGIEFYGQEIIPTKKNFDIIRRVNKGELSSKNVIILRLKSGRGYTLREVKAS
jgi:hypothetical protein